MTDHIHTINAYGTRNEAEAHQAWAVGNSPCTICGEAPVWDPFVTLRENPFEEDQR